MVTTNRTRRRRQAPVEEMRDALHELADRLERLDLERLLELFHVIENGRYGKIACEDFCELYGMEHEVDWAVSQTLNAKWRRRMARILRREARTL